MPNLYLYIGGIFFGISVIALHWGFTNPFDSVVVEFLSEHRFASLNVVTQCLSLIGGMPFVLLFTALWCLYFIVKKQYRPAIFIIVGIIGSIVLGWSLKWAFVRPRPDLVYAIVKSYGPSFPSAHSLYAATLASIGICLYRQQRSFYVVVLITIWWLVMGLSRVYAGVHFPTDVLAGWGLGFIWISLLWRLLLRINQKNSGSIF